MTRRPETPHLPRRRRRGAAWLSTFGLALSSVVQHPLRSFLSALALCVGVACIVAVHAVVGGLDVAFSSALPMYRPGVVYLTQRPFSGTEGGESDEWAKAPPVTSTEVRELGAFLTTASAIIPYTTTYLDSTASESVRVAGEPLVEVEVIGAPENWTLLGQHPVLGRFLSQAEADSSRRVAVVGADVYAKMQESGMGLGATITLADRPLEVVGVLEARGIGLWGVSLDSLVVVSPAIYKEVFGVGTSLTVAIVAASKDLESRTKDEVVGALRSLRRLRPGVPNNFVVDPADAGRKLYAKLTSVLRGITAALAALSVLISGGGILNIMLFSVSERTREIGVRGALGARPRMVLAQFLVEGAAISGIGGLTGTLLGVSVVWGITALTPLPARLSAAGVILGLTFGVSVGILFAVLPALRASRLMPSEAIRS